MVKYREATIGDIPLLVNSRMDLLRSANGLEPQADLSNIERELTEYYIKAISSGEHYAVLAFRENIFVGTGGICFYSVLPTYHNPTGNKAYIINMFTKPEYRGQGIATEILDRLVKQSFSKGVRFISLEATTLGKSLYEKYGFATMLNEMQLNNETYS